jgi:hypothetical protein
VDYINGITPSSELDYVRKARDRANLVCKDSAMRDMKSSKRAWSPSFLNSRSPAFVRSSNRSESAEQSPIRLGESMAVQTAALWVTQKGDAKHNFQPPHMKGLQIRGTLKMSASAPSLKTKQYFQHMGCVIDDEDGSDNVIEETFSKTEILRFVDSFAKSATVIEQRHTNSTVKQANTPTSPTSLIERRHTNSPVKQANTLTSLSRCFSDSLDSEGKLQIGEVFSKHTSESNTEKLSQEILIDTGEGSEFLLNSPSKHTPESNTEKLRQDILIGTGEGSECLPNVERRNESPLLINDGYAEDSYSFEKLEADFFQSENRPHTPSVADMDARPNWRNLVPFVNMADGHDHTLRTDFFILNCPHNSTAALHFSSKVGDAIQTIVTPKIDPGPRGMYGPPIGSHLHPPRKSTRTNI